MICGAIENAPAFVRQAIKLSPVTIFRDERVYGITAYDGTDIGLAVKALDGQSCPVKRGATAAQVMCWL